MDTQAQSSEAKETLRQVERQRRTPLFQGRPDLHPYPSLTQPGFIRQSLNTEGSRLFDEEDAIFQEGVEAGIAWAQMRD